MADIVSAEIRSRMMSGIRGKDTRPEVLVRRGLHALGFRFRLHVSDLPGTPDIVLPKFHAVILVNGCFWHGHDCPLFRWPKSRRHFWRQKISRNRTVDSRAVRNLQQAGWRVMTVWECSIKGRSRLPADKVVISVARWLRSKSSRHEIRG